MKAPKASKIMKVRKARKKWGHARHVKMWMYVTHEEKDEGT